jgi:Domain of unknown function (DUF397)
MTGPQVHVSADVQWRKSSYSNAGNQCVEVARIGGAVAVRDSKNPGGGHLTFKATEWEAFLDSVRRGGYDQ